LLHTNLKERDSLEQICCGGMLEFTVCLNKGDFSCALYLYCAGQQNVHCRCEVESETVVGVTCGELLAV
jgi:hypothetical protein